MEIHLGKSLIHKIRGTTVCLLIILKSVPEGNQIKEDVFLLDKILEFVANQGPLKKSQEWRFNLNFFFFSSAFPSTCIFEPLKQITSKKILKKFVLLHHRWLLQKTQLKSVFQSGFGAKCTEGIKSILLKFLQTEC